MAVSRATLHRALLLAHGMITGAVRRGWAIEAYGQAADGTRAGVAIVIGGHRYPLEIHEETRALAFTPAEIAAWRKRAWLDTDRGDRMPPPQLKRKEPTGRLRLHLPNGYRGGRSSWTDGPGSLNGRLDHVLEVLAQRAVRDDRAAVEARRWRETFEREQAARAEQVRRQRVEEARANRALAETKAWREAAEMRAYATALRLRIPALDARERDRIEPWCDWIEDRIRRTDPAESTTLIIGLDDERDGRGW